MARRRRRFRPRDGWKGATAHPLLSGRTGPLRREIAQALPERPFHLRFWDDTTVPATTDGAPEFHVRSPTAIAHFVRSPGELGLGRAYVAGELTVDDLDAAFLVVDDWEPPAIPPGARLRIRLLGDRVLQAVAWKVADQLGFLDSLVR